MNFDYTPICVRCSTKGQFFTKKKEVSNGSFIMYTFCKQCKALASAVYGKPVPDLQFHFEDGKDEAYFRSLGAEELLYESRALSELLTLWIEHEETQGTIPSSLYTANDLCIQELHRRLTVAGPVQHAYLSEEPYRTE